MGGGGKSGGGARGGGTTTTQLDPEAMATTKMVREVTEPVLRETAGQILEALTTGGIGARIPIAKKSMEASRAATATALRQTGEELTRTGQAGTPFGQNILADLRLAGETGTATIPTDIAQGFINVAPSFALGGPAMVLQALARAGTQTSTSRVRTTRPETDWLTDVLVPLIGAFAGGVGAGVCWIAFVLYGPSREFIAAWRWINVEWRGPLADATRWLYERVGPWVARHPHLCELLRPLFDLAVRRALRA